MPLAKIPGRAVEDGSIDTADLATGLAVPTGAVLPFAGSSAPAGYLLCDGAAVSRTTYSALFTALGTTYGVGDGSTTFNVPDLRGRVVAGKDDMGGAAASRITSGGSGITGTTLGATGGTETHTLTAAQSGLPAHNHGSPEPNGFIIDTTWAANGSWSYPSSGTALGSYANTGDNSDADASAAHQNVPPAIVLNYIIKT